METASVSRFRVEGIGTKSRVTTRVTRIKGRTLAARRSDRNLATTTPITPAIVIMHFLLAVLVAVFAVLLALPEAQAAAGTVGRCGSDRATLN